MHCTSLSSGNQVDGSPLALSTEAILAVQGKMVSDYFQNCRFFSYVFEYFRLRIDLMVLKFFEYDCNELRNALDWMGKKAKVLNLCGRRFSYEFILESNILEIEIFKENLLKIRYNELESV